MGGRPGLTEDEGDEATLVACRMANRGRGRYGIFEGPATGNRIAMGESTPKREVLASPVEMREIARDVQLIVVLILVG